MKHRKYIAVVCYLLALAAIFAGVFLYWQSTRPIELPVPRYEPDPTDILEVEPDITPRPDSVPSQGETRPLDGGFPQDKLFITSGRKNYKSSDIKLRIPKLQVHVPVLDGVDRETLRKGVGLYDYAQLPDEWGGNVSIAGHRNSIRNGKINDDMPFYYLDTLGSGDYLYLTDDENIYQYLWERTYVVTPDNWGPIYCQGSSCITLTTCTPIGVADHRLIVVGRLVETLPMDEAYDYPAQRAE